MGIPAAELPLSASAPGKCIVFGEHAVVHGGPELLFALDLRTQVVARPGDVTTLNGNEESARQNSYLVAAIAAHAPGAAPLEITTVSRIPRAAGLGSSAALVSALASVLGSRDGGVDRPTLAQRAFAIERAAQGVGSPGDTSASVAGGFLTLNSDLGVLLWEVGDGLRQWTARRIPDPGWSWVVADTGVARATGPAVERVGRKFAGPGGSDLLERFRRVADEGIRAVASEDRVATGRWMRANQALLREADVSHPRLESLIEVARETSDGEKLTGAGCGGSVVALPKPGREIETARRLRRAGGNAFVVVPTPDGARLLSP